MQRNGLAPQISITLHHEVGWWLGGGVVPDSFQTVLDRFRPVSVRFHPGSDPFAAVWVHFRTILHGFHSAFPDLQIIDLF